MNDKYESLQLNRYEEIVLGDCYQSIREWIKLRISLLTICAAATGGVIAVSIQAGKPMLLYVASGILVGFIIGDIALRKYVTPYLYISWKIENKYAENGFGVSYVIIKWHCHSDKIFNAFDNVFKNKEKTFRIRDTAILPLGNTSRIGYGIFMLGAFALAIMAHIL